MMNSELITDLSKFLAWYIASIAPLVIASTVPRLLPESRLQELEDTYGRLKGKLDLAKGSGFHEYARDAFDDIETKLLGYVRCPQLATATET